MRVLRLAASTLLLALTLGAPAAFASPAPTAGGGDLLLQLRAFLASLWSDEGCRLDPWGRCIPGTASPHARKAKEGCEIDPLGRCATSPKATLTVKEGCRIDPWGSCITRH